MRVSEEREMALLKYSVVKKNEGFQLPSVSQCSSKILTPKDIRSLDAYVNRTLLKHYFVCALNGARL